MLIGTPKLMEENEKCCLHRRTWWLGVIGASTDGVTTEEYIQEISPARSHVLQATIEGSRWGGLNYSLIMPTIGTTEQKRLRDIHFRTPVARSTTEQQRDIGRHASCVVQPAVARSTTEQQRDIGRHASCVVQPAVARSTTEQQRDIGRHASCVVQPAVARSTTEQQRDIGRHASCVVQPAVARSTTEQQRDIGRHASCVVQPAVARGAALLNSRET